MGVALELYATSKKMGKDEPHGAIWGPGLPIEWCLHSCQDTAGSPGHG
jgi:hypothetical protein